MTAVWRKSWLVRALLPGGRTSGGGRRPGASSYIQEKKRKKTGKRCISPWVCRYSSRCMVSAFYLALVSTDLVCWSASPWVQWSSSPAVAASNSPSTHQGGVMVLRSLLRSCILVTVYTDSVKTRRKWLLIFSVWSTVSSLRSFLALVEMIHWCRL